MLNNPDCRDRNIYNQAINRIEEVFQNNGNQLQKVNKLAQRIKHGINKVSPFIQQITQTVCPQCKDVCCISKHGYYNYEDLVYIHALGLKPPAYEFGRNDSDPCQFLSEKGCIMERATRPSGCNWYFCDSLFDNMEKRPGYQKFDDALREIAELWMEMIEEFAGTSPLQ